tara:strand:- start:11472 stop:11831 length:360 start_codon:yes stop_codon:yes gene_type:complete
MTKSKSIEEQGSFKSYFEANFLDGDDVHDCGGAMLSAEDVYEILAPYIAEQEAEAERLARVDERKNINADMEGFRGKAKPDSVMRNETRITNQAINIFRGINNRRIVELTRKVGNEKCQ